MSDVSVGPRDRHGNEIEYDEIYWCYLPNGTAVRLGGLEMLMWGATLDRPNLTLPPR